MIRQVAPDLAGIRVQTSLGKPPLEPNARQTSSDEDFARGSLSDFSDYESSDEETHNKNSRIATSSSNNYSGGRAYPEASGFDATIRKDSPGEDPFADPFGDSHRVDVLSSAREKGRQRGL